MALFVAKLTNLWRCNKTTYPIGNSLYIQMEWMS
ncbi:hypothetical protein MASSI9I_10351 [Massilia sp. 9I]|nr:hypothetical protein MASSI9I_10351 [Massilia sp. 9I]